MDITKSTFTLTFGDCAENHVGMEQLGERVEAGEGFTCEELIEFQTKLQAKGIPCEYNSLDGPEGAAEAAVLVIKGGVNSLLASTAASTYVQVQEVSKSSCWCF
jgi:hypothetical protein